MPRRSWLIFLILLAANYLLLRGLFSPASTTIPYTTFLQQAVRGNVARVLSRGDRISGQFVRPVAVPVSPVALDSAERDSAARDSAAAAKATNSKATTKTPPRTIANFTTVLPSFAGRSLESLLVAHGTEIDAQSAQGNSWSGLMLSFVPSILIIALYVWLFRRASAQTGGGSGLFRLGKSTARRFDQTSDVRVTFSDVAGIDEAENELIEIVDFLKDPQKYTRLGGAAPKGVLLIGAPGTGKTLLARAVAGEAGVPFFSMAGSEFVEMIVGVGAARVRDLFKEARANAPAIIFIDELDSIGRARGMIALGGASEQEQTLNQILAEMDGFSAREGIIVIGATNQPDVLDKALLRPGRFDRRVIVNLPDKGGREAILGVHTRKVPLANDVSLSEIAAATPGLAGADLKNLVNEAALLAARRNENQVHEKDFTESLEKIVLGPQRALLLTRSDRQRIAYHEGGHAILGLVVAGADPVHSVSIVPRGQALGATYQRPENDRYNYPEAYLRARIIGMLGGRAAEEIVFGTKTTGAQNDIEQASALARDMVTRWGMSERLGLVELAPRENPYLPGIGGASGFDGSRGLPYSEETAAAVDAEVRRIIAESHEDALRLLRAHRRELDALADALLERETLDESGILSVTGLTRAPALYGGKLSTGD